MAAGVFVCAPHAFKKTKRRHEKTSPDMAARCLRCFLAAGLSAAAAQPAGYGEPLRPAPTCLTGRSTISGFGRQQYCIDVLGPATLGQKLVVNVATPHPAAEVVKVGSESLVRSINTSISAHHIVGPLIEVKPFQQACENCDRCPCVGIGCGPRCECSCNALCRLRHEPSCAHTAGVLHPGRWWLAVRSGRPSNPALPPTACACSMLPKGDRFASALSRWTHRAHSRSRRRL
jgi:hypothetical protein